MVKQGAIQDHIAVRDSDIREYISDKSIEYQNHPQRRAEIIRKESIINDPDTLNALINDPFNINGNIYCMSYI